MDNSGLADDAALLGIAGLPEPDPNADAFEIWPENWETLTIFMALTTQFNGIAGMAGVVWTGINYPSVLTVFELYGVSDRRAMFEDLRAMELAALEVLNDRG